jgi:hypothetical protein
MVFNMLAAVAESKTSLGLASFSLRIISFIASAQSEGDSAGHALIKDVKSPSNS